VVSADTVQDGTVEVRLRRSDEVRRVPIHEIAGILDELRKEPVNGSL
jgi:glycyl-tRNA synthetase (class II)